MTAERVEATPPDALLALPVLIAAATELPWQPMNDYQWDMIIGGIDGPDDGEMRYTTITDITVDGPQARANARLIVAAVNALPGLLARVDSLRAALVDLEEAYCDAGPDMTREKRNFGRKALIAARAALNASAVKGVG